MPELDLTELIPQQTLKITVLRKDGTRETWEIPPFDNETEHGYWKWQKALMEARKEEQEAAMGILEGKPVSDKEETSGEIWAPLLAMVVKTPALDEDTLIRDYPGVVLARAGGAVMSFFLTGELPGFQKEPETTKVPAVPGRSRRKTMK